MRLCNETITIFNARLNPDLGRDVYHGTIIKGVSWFGTSEARVENGGLKTADSFRVRIPDGAIIDGDKTYIDFRQFNNADPARHFTFRKGDIVVRAAVTAEDPLPAELLRQYEAFTILGATDNHRTVNAPHWKVVGG